VTAPRDDAGDMIHNFACVFIVVKTLSQVMVASLAPPHSPHT
jgi:hypothetical protein